MAKLRAKSLILAKLESPYGTDPTPSASTDAIITGIPQIELLGEPKQRNVVKPAFGMVPPINFADGIKITFDVEMYGVLVGASTPPIVGRLLRACGLTETIDNNVDVRYAFNSDYDGDSITIYYYQDGILHKATGCRGTFSTNLQVNEIAVFTFEFTGLYAGKASFASDVSFATPTFATHTPQIFNTAVLTANSYAAIIENLEFNINNNVVKRPSANAAYGVHSYSIVERDISGSIDPEVVALATFNPWALWADNTEFTLTFKIGAKITWSFNKVMVEQVTPGARESISTYGITWKPHIGLITGTEMLVVFAA